MQGVGRVVEWRVGGGMWEGGKGVGGKRGVVCGEGRAYGPGYEEA